MLKSDTRGQPAVRPSGRPILRPILKWAGGKTGLLPQLLPYFPKEFNRYVEPFLGGGAVFLALDSGEMPALLNDANPELIHLYEVVRDQPDELMKCLDDYARHYSEAFYYEVRSQVPETPLARAARMIFLNKCGYNGLYRQNKKGGFNVPFGKRKTCPALYDRENLLKVSQKFASAEFCCRDFESVIDGAGPGDFVYCDPPYAPISTTSSFNSYMGKGFDEREQKRLRDSLVRAADRGAMVLMSNSSARVISDLYEGFPRVMIAARRAINSKASERGPIEEVLVGINLNLNVNLEASMGATSGPLRAKSAGSALRASSTSR